VENLTTRRKVTIICLKNTRRKGLLVSLISHVSSFPYYKIIHIFPDFVKKTEKHFLTIPLYLTLTKGKIIKKDLGWIFMGTHLINAEIKEIF